jgi:hypothetical protein
MTITFQTASDKNPIGALFQSFQQVNGGHSAGTGHDDDSDIGGITQSHGTCQVRSRISSVIATKCNNGWLKLRHWLSPSLPKTFGKFRRYFDPAPAGLTPVFCLLFSLIHEATRRKTKSHKEMILYFEFRFPSSDF